jgi:hypothetical protein
MNQVLRFAKFVTKSDQEVLDLTQVKGKLRHVLGVEAVESQSLDVREQFRFL